MNYYEDEYATILSEYDAQFVAVLKLLTNDSYTNIDPNVPVYVEIDIGVLSKTLGANVGTVDVNKYSDIKEKQLRKAFEPIVVQVGKLAVVSAIQL